MTAPLVTALYAAILGLLAVILTVNVIRNRVGLKIDDGDGGNATMGMAIRAHANFAQHAPLALLLIGIAETIGTGKTIIHVLGAAWCWRACSAHGGSQARKDRVSGGNRAPGSLRCWCLPLRRW